MAIHLKDPETNRLARDVAALTGETLTDVIRIALKERLERETLLREKPSDFAERLHAIAVHCAALPDLDPRTPDEIVGYDETGLW